MYLDARRVRFLELAGDDQANKSVEEEVVNREVVILVLEVNVEVVEAQEEGLVLQFELAPDVHQSVENEPPVVLEQFFGCLLERVFLAQRFVVQVQANLQQMVWVHGCDLPLEHLPSSFQLPLVFSHYRDYLPKLASISPPVSFPLHMK